MNDRFYDQPLITQVAMMICATSALAFLGGLPLITFSALVAWQPYHLTAFALCFCFVLLFFLSGAVVTFTATGVEGRFLRGTLPEQQGYTGREILEMNDDGTYGEQP